MKNFKLGFLALFFLLLASKGYSQVCAGNKVTITLQNITNPTTTTLEFDVYIANTGTTSLLLGGLQGGVIFNSGMLPATATGTFSCITQPSATGNFPNFINVTIPPTITNNQLRWTNNPVNLASGNTINITSTPLKFARFRFTSSLPWTANFAGTLTEQYSVQTGYTQFAATVYCNGNSNSTGLSSATPGTLVCNNSTNSAYPITLNACAIAASQTASTAVSCFGGTNGSSTITMSTIPSVLDITYTVDSGASQSATLTSGGAFTITGLTAGSHTVVISNSVCSNVTATGVTIAGPTLLVASGTPTAISCYGGNSTVVVTATGGTAPYTGTGSFPHIAGAYSYTVTDTKGCTSIASGTITQPTALVASATPTAILCYGGNSSVVVTATGGTTPYTGTNTFTHAAGAYSYTVTDFKGCTSIASGTISQPAALLASASAGTIACNGGTTTITVSSIGGTAPFTGTGTFTVSAGPYSYTVTDTNGCTSIASGTISQPDVLVASASAGTISCNAGTTTITVSTSGGTAPFTGTGTFTVSAGPYSYTVTDANGCASSASGTITEPTALVASASAGTITCNGGTTTITVSATGGTDPLTGTGTFTVSAGPYSYTVTDANGCTSIASGTISQPAPLVASASAGTIACNGGTTSITVSATGGTAPFTGTGTFTVSAGPYSYTVTDANGCTSNASGTISEPASLVASASAGTIACNGGTTTITVSANGGTAPFTGTGTFTASVGAYSYTVTDANGCTSITSGTITEPTALIASASAGTIACNGGTTTITVSANGGTAPLSGTGTFTVSAGPYSYTVTDANGCTSIASGTITQPTTLVASASAGTITCNGGTTTITISANGGTAPFTGTGTFTVSAGPYSYTVTDANGCTAVASGTLTQPATSVASASAGTIACNGGTTTITISANGGTAPFTGTGTFTVSAGPYSYTVTDANGCTSIASGTITQPTALVASASPSAISCNGGNATVTVSATGGTTPYVSSSVGSFPHAAGAYSYTVTDANGCTAIASGTITQPTALVASASPSAISCNGGNSTVTVSATGGTTPYVSSSVGSFPHAAGAYSYTVTDANGCTAVASGTITEPAPLTTSTTMSACDTYTWNGTTYTISGDYTYNSTNGSGCSVVNTLHLTINNSTTSSETQVTCAAYTWHGTTYTTSGDYTYTSTNASGCNNVATLHLTFNTTTTSETQVACDGYTWHGTTYTVSGDYTYNSTNTAGCLNVATLHLTINHITTPVFDSVAPICFGTALSNLPTTSNQGLTGSWLPATMNNSATTTYTFTPAPGQCAAVSQMTIQVIPLASAPTAATDQNFNLGDTLSNLIVTTGSNLTWYASQSSTTSIPNTTTLVDGTTYYVSQTINGCEGPKIAITVHLIILGVDQNQIVTISYSPNPVIDVLVIKSNESIENITVFNTLGQLLFTLIENANEFSVDLSNLPTGSYFIKAQTADKNQILKVIKK